MKCFSLLNSFNMEKMMRLRLVFMIFCCCTFINCEDSTTVKNRNRFDVQSLNKVLREMNPHFAETFNDKDVLNKKWIISKAKKDGVEGDLAKYDGDWLIDLPLKHAMLDDYGLVFQQRAKHRAVSSPLIREFVFDTKPFILQYEVLFQEGQECGGGYIKLISGTRDQVNLKQFHDKTPYTIMFGPDKCGSTSKVHFIFRHKNPINGSFEEKHCKPLPNRFDEVFSDGKPHLFTLIILPDNTFKIQIDRKVVNEGSLLLDFTPPVNPPAEVDDPSDSKPENWDDREKIPDPLATKPDDWDEDAPHTIPDPTAVKPDNWLVNEPLYIKDPSAEKPHDWDVEMDGEWEAPLVPNPACEDAGGCEEWIPPRINNPAYKGKWSAPLIVNPEYKGKWSPRKIPNANYFEDKEPFKMAKIAAVGFELWSMTGNILFDNIILTDSLDFAKTFTEATFDVKIQNIEQSAESILNQFITFTNRYPWLWAIYTVVILVIVTLIVYCCFWNSKDNYEHKKTDSPQRDDQNEETNSSAFETTFNTTEVGETSDITAFESTFKTAEVGETSDVTSLESTFKTAEVGKTSDVTSLENTFKTAEVGESSDVASLESTFKTAEVGETNDVTPLKSTFKTADVGNTSDVTVLESTFKTAELGETTDVNEEDFVDKVSEPEGSTTPDTEEEAGKQGDIEEVTTSSPEKKKPVDKKKNVIEGGVEL